MLGVALGVVARAWMRVVSDDPAFTWNGTLAIVVGFGVFGVLQANAIRARRHSHGWRLSVGRALGGLGMVPLFLAAGAVLAPTVVVGGLAVARTSLRPAVRVAAGVVGLVPLGFVIAGFVADLGASSNAWAGIAGVLAIYAVIVGIVASATFAERTDHYRLPRAVRLGVIGAGVMAGTVALIAGGIQ